MGMKTLLLAAALLVGCGPVDLTTQADRCHAETAGMFNNDVHWSACMKSHGWPDSNTCRQQSDSAAGYLACMNHK